MNNLRGKNAILYRRVSTTDQKTFGNSLNAQQSSLKDFCDKNALNVIKEFQEDYSAKDFNRPEWKRLNKFAKENKKKLTTYSLQVGIVSQETHMKPWEEYMRCGS